MNPNNQIEKDDAYYEQFATPDQKQYYSNEPTTAKDIPRIATQYASRAGETVLGLSGDIRQGLRGLITAGAEKVAGKEIPYLHETEEQAAIRSKSIPTSAELRKRSEKFTKGYTAPRGEWEELGGNIISDATPLFVLPGGMGVLRSLGVAAGGNIASQVVKKLGGGEKAQGYAKLGTMFLLGSINPGGVKAYKSQLYEKRDALLPQGASTKADTLLRRLHAVEQKAAKGGTSQASEKVKEYSRSLRNRIDDGNIEINELTAAKRKINDNRTQYAASKDDRQLFNEIADAVDNSIEVYGIENPEFYNAHTSADLAHGTLENSQQVSTFLKKHLKTPSGYVTGTLFGLGVGLPKTISGAIGTYGFSKASQIVQHIYKSQELKRYYTQVVQNSLKGNAPLALKYLDKLESGVKKSMKEEKPNKLISNGTQEKDDSYYEQFVAQ